LASAHTAATAAPRRGDNTMNSATSLAELDRLQSIHPHTNLRKHEDKGPVIMARGRGIHVYDADGREYIEGMAGLWCASLGFSNERLIAAATRQLNTLPYYHGFAHKTSDVAIEAARDLLAIAPGKMARAFFGTTGSDANDTAIKMVRYYNNALGRPNKKKVISRTRGYHGVSLATASLTALPNIHAGFDLPGPGVLHTDCPHHYRFAQQGESEEAFAQRLAASLDALIEKEGADTIAAFIAEPVMGAGGVIVPPATYFDVVQPILKKHDILLIADEVICGFGRTGQMWGSQTYGIDPDIVTCAKALTGAYVPFSATMISARLYEPIAEHSAKLGNFGHGYTYSAHPLGAAVAVEALKIYREIDVAARVRTLAPQFQTGLRRLGESPIVGEVRGVGLIAAIELVSDKSAKTPFPPSAALATYLAERAHAHGLVVRPLGDAVALCPPLIIEPAQIDEMLARFERALRETETYAATLR
jgi:4-aminobutyrate--pyruvate transaminase